MHDEVWVDLFGFEGSYKLSSYGRVKSVKRYIPCRGGHTRLQGEMEIQAQYNSVGGRVVRIYKGGKGQSLTLAALVLEHFGSPRPEGSTVKHEDGDRDNLHYRNLSWVPKAKKILSQQEILEIVQLLETTTLTQRDIAKRYNTHQNTISRINTGKTAHIQGVKNGVNHQPATAEHQASPS